MTRRSSLAAVAVAFGCAFTALSYAQDDMGTARRGHRHQRIDQTGGTNPAQPDGAGSVSLPPCDHDGTVTMDLSTGTTNGNTNVVGAVDPKWKLISAPTGGPVSGNLYSRGPYGGFWDTPAAPATWVTPWNNNGSFTSVGNAVQGDYHYGVTFNVPAGYSNITVSGVCRADDEGTVSMGMQNMGTPLCHFSGPIGTFSFSGNAGSSNTLDVKVHNGPPTISRGVTSDPTGLMVQAKVTATCKVIHITIPANHYLCYNVEKPWKADVMLRDQFGAFKFHVMYITRLCNPVEKQYNRTVSKIYDPRLHYVCYRGEAKGTSRNVMVYNQFGSTTLRANGPTELCLPSYKKELIDGGGSSGTDQQQ